MADNPIIDTVRMDEKRIKLALTVDIVVSLMNTLIHLKLGREAPVAKKKEFIDAYLKIWRNGLEYQIEKVYKHQVQTIEKTNSDLDSDVVHILIEIANTEGLVIRNEFFDVIQKGLYKALLGNVGA
jgi:hypothetical protein